MNRNKTKLRLEINKQTKGCIMVEIHLSIQSEDHNQGILREYGSYVILTVNRERQNGYIRLMEERNLKKQIIQDSLRIRNNGMIEENLMEDNNQIRIEDPQFPKVKRYNPTDHQKGFVINGDTSQHYPQY